MSYRRPITSADINVRAIIRTNVASLTGIPASSVTDGVSCVADDLVLLTGQTTATQNGVYALKAGAWQRVGLVVGRNASGVRVRVAEGQWWGNRGRGTRWVCTSLVGADVVGTDNLTWRNETLRMRDIAYDSFDVFALLDDDQALPTGTTSTIKNLINGTDDWTFTLNAGNSAIDAQWWSRGPFGNRSVFLYANNVGLRGPDNSYPLTASYTFSAWICFEAYVSGASYQEMLVASRTNTLTPGNTGFPADYTFSFSCPGSGAGATQEFYRLLRLRNRHSGGLNSLDGALGRGSLPVGEWMKVDIVRDGTAGQTNFYLNGLMYNNYVTDAPITTSTGIWSLGCPRIVDGSGNTAGTQVKYSSVRYATTARSPEFIAESYARGAWAASAS